MLSLIVGGEIAQIRRHARVLACQVGADDLPGVAAISGLEQNVGTEIQRVLVFGRKDERRSAVIAVLAGTKDYGAYVLRLRGGLVVLASLTAVDDVGIERVGRNVAIFLCADGMPVAKGDFAVITAAGGTDGPALLLPAVDPVGKTIVGDDVIELRGRLVVPGTPGFAAVDSERGALVDTEQDDLWIEGIDPDAMVIVATGRAFDGCEILAAIGGAIGRSVGDVDDIGIARIH